MTSTGASPGNEPDGRLVERDGVAEIRFERIYPHGIEEVWDAITDPTRIQKWWLPFDAEIELDLTPGGKYEIRGTGSEPISMIFEVVRVEPPRLFEHTTFDPGSTATWVLEKLGETCRLLLIQTAPTAQTAIERNYLVGLHTSLDRLSRELDGSTDNPWESSRFEEHRSRYHAQGLA